jgi:hypothetical protein
LSLPECITTFVVRSGSHRITSPRSLEYFYQASLASIYNPPHIIPRDTCFKCANKKRREILDFISTQFNMYTHTGHTNPYHLNVIHH